MWNKEYGQISRAGFGGFPKTTKEGHLRPWEKSNDKGQHVGQMSNGTARADAVTEGSEDLFGRTVFIGKRNENTFSVFRRDRRQREHVTADDVFLERRDIKITAGIFGGCMRVGKAVELFELDVMPVVKEIIVKKSAAYELFLLEAEGKYHGP